MTSLSVQFECLSEKTTIIREVKLPPVTSVLQIKQYLEDKHNVPVCMQTLRHRSVVLNEDTSIASLRLRAGDELHVSYYAAAECEALLSVIKWLETTLSIVRDKKDPDDYPLHPLDDLSNMFKPWGTPAKLANVEYFIAKGGLRCLMELYGSLLEHKWENMSNLWRYLEKSIIISLWDMSLEVSHRQLIVKEGGLRMCLASLTRVPVPANKPLLEIPCLKVVSFPDMFDPMLCNLISNVIGVLNGFSEITSQVEIATNMEVMKQLSRVVSCPSFDIEVIISVTLVGLTLAYTTETHSSLIDSGLVDSLLTYTTSAIQLQSSDMADRALLEYHIAMLATKIVLVSPQLISKQELQIHNHLMRFLETAHHSLITQYETAMEYVWATFLPYIKLIYHPNTPCREPLLLSETQDMALQTTIIALHSMLDRSIHREVLVREGLVDYLICMPWYTTGSAQQRSRALVRMVQQSPDVDLQPPSLLNMTKACVAKNYCGLQTVVHLSVPDIIQQICF